MLTVLLRPSEKRMRMMVECARECVSNRMSAMHKPSKKRMRTLGFVVLDAHELLVELESTTRTRVVRV